MLDPKLKEKIATAYAAIGDIGYSIALNLRKGKDYTTKQKELKDKGRKLRLFLKIFLRHVDPNTTPPTLYRITETQANKLINCMEKVGRLNTYPIVPYLFPVPRPLIITTGLDGTDGTNGQDGDDANIIVEPDAGEEQITVTSAVVLGVRHDKIKFTPYIAPIVTISIQSTKIIEGGVVVAGYNINITTTKGSKDITALTITNDSALNTILQGIINLVSINGVSQPVITVLPDTTISADTDYIVGVTDDQTPSTDEDSIRFYFPFLYGDTPTTTPTHYTALTKLIEAQGNKEFILDGVGQYFWIGYPSSYPALARIRDQNGFVVTSDFTIVIANVTSVGLDNNWIEEYRFYRTTLTTDISNEPYTIEF